VTGPRDFYGAIYPIKGLLMTLSHSQVLVFTIFWVSCLSNDLYERGLFIAGDTAYAITPFLIASYESRELQNDVMKAKDGFNYQLSSCQIYIECAFGELVMQWGIF
jgi:hypothetical protein